MTPIDWFALLHPVLVILFVYPVVGATIRLGILVREERLGITKQPAPVPREHADHGRWLTAGVVVAVLIALVYSFISKAAAWPRLALLLLVAAGTLVALLALLKVKRPLLRASFTLLTWAAAALGEVLGIGGEMERLVEFLLLLSRGDMTAADGEAGGPAQGCRRLTLPEERAGGCS